MDICNKKFIDMNPYPILYKIAVANRMLESRKKYYSPYAAIPGAMGGGIMGLMLGRRAFHRMGIPSDKYEYIVNQIFNIRRKILEEIFHKQFNLSNELSAYKDLDKDFRQLGRKLENRLHPEILKLLNMEEGVRATQKDLEKLQQLKSKFMKTMPNLDKYIVPDELLHAASLVTKEFPEAYKYAEKLEEIARRVQAKINRSIRIGQSLFGLIGIGIGAMSLGYGFPYLLNLIRKRQRR